MKGLILSWSVTTVVYMMLSLSGCKDEEYPIVNNNTGNHTMTDIKDIRGYRDCYLGTFRCGIFVPRSYSEGIRYPLIIYLHGYSDTTTWELEWYKEPLVDSDPCIVMTPKCPTSEYAGWGDSWTERVSPMMQNAFLMYDLVDQNYTLDHDRIYIYGTSMGGFGTYAALQQHPFMFAAAFVECGSGNPEMAGILKNIPLWIFHGSDDPVVSVQGARNMYKAILEAGGTLVRYTEYPGVQHNTWDYVKYETTLPYWLLAQRKGSVHGSPGRIPEFETGETEDQHVKLNWQVVAGEQVKDNNYWYCRIYRDNDLLAEIYNDRNEFIDTTVQINKSYRYYITAVNFFFKESRSPAPQTITLMP